MTSCVPLFAIKRLQRDYHDILECPLDNIQAHPTDENILEWHFALIGPTNSPFEGGIYHGELIFPENYPLDPPSIYFITPNGKFKPNSDLCYSHTDDDYVWKRWSAADTVSSILLSLAEKFLDHKTDPFMSVDIVPEDQQKELAQNSKQFNLKDKTFCKYFPNIYGVIE